jgi:predicted transposase/invertase (TIGR01784 family)
MMSFDWAMKRLLRNKANFEVLEGFLSELLRRKIIIKYIGESEGNMTDKDDKFNRVDMLVEADDRELVIVELQYHGQDDYFKRILYGVSKAITDHTAKGDPYANVRKIYSISIVNFDLGSGDDYIYHGFTSFKGLHTQNELQLSAKDMKLYSKTRAGDLYPEYYIIKVRKFDEVAKDALDEWIFYLKTSKIRDEFTAQGMDRARQILAYDNLTDAEKKAHDYIIYDRLNRDSEITTAFSDGEFKGEERGLKKGEAIGLKKGEASGLKKGEAIGLKKGEALGLKKAVINGANAGYSIEIIAAFTGLTAQQVTEILKSDG